ncbi:MAG: glycosyltransferase [Gammaproteobacteria bacterium]|nr:glycosyltransferase [Gammaproteobacteria bacterium]
MSGRPLVSVIMPVRNCGDWLAPAVDSILGQTVEDLELLIIDDHSFDGSVERLPQDPRLRIFRHAGNGIVASLNAGLIRARGEFIARMDGDDISVPERLQRQLHFAKDNPDIAIVGGLVDIFSDDGDIQAGNRAYQAWLNGLLTADDIERELFVESPLVHPSVLIRREVFKRIGLYRDLSWPEDYDLWLRASLAGLRFAKVPELVLMWREHPARLTNTDKRYSRKEFIKAKAWAMSESVLRNRPAIICGTGKLAVKLCDVLQRLGVAVMAFVDIAPDNIGKSRRGLPILSYDDMLDMRQDALIVGALGARGAGEALRELLLLSGLHEGRDFLLAG